MNFFNTFSKAASLNPNNTCIVGNGESISYSLFLSSVNSLAQSLPINLQQSCAAIVLPRQKEIVSWQLALNSKNIVFSTLDAIQPFNRLEKMLTALSPSLVICEASNLELISWCTAFNMLPLNNINMASNSAALEKGNSDIIVFISHHYKIYNEAYKYIVFSSGSTGQPKAIALGDEGAVRTIEAQIKSFDIKPQDRVIWALTPAFDASLSDIYSALFSGASLYIYPLSLSKIKTLIDFLKTNKISVADLPPSILPFIDLNSLTDLKKIIFGGEVANEEVILKHSLKAQMFNVYGPTETSICASFSLVTPSWTSSCIGKPLKGFIFSIETNGELIISSSLGHIAFEYLGLNELNKAKFFENQNGLKSFRTGDAASFDGNNYFYLGRLDRQFKHLGNLVSPEEIEKVALNFSAITHAQVDYDFERKSITLNACLKPTNNNAREVDLIENIEYTQKKELELKRHLNNSLPSFMQPSVINFVALKTNFNGKVSL